MPATVMLRVIFYGLIAFTPGSDPSHPSFHALLVDGIGRNIFTSNGCQLPQHAPLLLASAGGCHVEGAGAGSCTLSADLARPLDPLVGSWRLDGQSLRIEVVSADTKRVRRLATSRSGPPRSNLPTTPQESESLSWIPSLVNLKVDPDCLKGKTRHCPITARVTLDEGEVSSCLLSENNHQVNTFDFKPLGSNAEPLFRQALASAVMVTVPVPRNAEVRINFQSLMANERGEEKVVVLTPGDREVIDVWVGNVPFCASQGHDDKPGCHDDATDTHYELYYGLTKTPVKFSNRPVPHRSNQPRSSMASAQVQPTGIKQCKLPTYDQLQQEKEECGGRIPIDWKACTGTWLENP